ncbi:MAG: hypothetical protein HW381_1902 [Candidatus Rokubacteria bacterium]|nr:hypothetical protein [Candidatus Rokubacteria bacterium]
MTGRRSRLLGAVWAGLASIMAGGCATYISPLQPPPYRDQIAAPYDVTWNALIRALIFDNVPLRAVAKDSGVIASDDIVSPIGVHADCGSLGDKPLEGEALVTFTVFVRPNGGTTDLQINSKMRTFRLGKPGRLRPNPNYGCVSTTRWEPNLVDSVRGLVKE